MSSSVGRRYLSGWHGQVYSLARVLVCGAGVPPATARRVPCPHEPTINPPRTNGTPGSCGHALWPSSRANTCPRPPRTFLSRSIIIPGGRGHGTHLSSFSKWIFRALLLLSICFLTGCHHEEPENIRHFPLTDAPATLRALADRAHLVHTLSGEGLITLTRPDGQSIRLDAALVMRPPDDARVRAWKFGRAIFDLTITPAGVWAITPDDPDHKEQIHAAGVNAAKLAKTWSVLSGGFFDEPNLSAQTEGAKLILRRKSPNQPTVLCEVDRATLTPRKYLLLDDTGHQRFSLTLDHYKQFGQITWPTRLTAISEGGTVEVDLHDVQINPDLPKTAFIPPRRAEKLP